MTIILRMFARLVAFTIVAAFGGVAAGLTFMIAGAIFYNTGFQFPLSFYGSIAVIIVSIGKYKLDKSEYEPKREKVSAPVTVPSNYRQGPLIQMY